MDWASGLLGGVAGVADSVVDMAQSRQKELAEKLKMQAQHDYQVAIEERRQKFEADQNKAKNEHSLILEGKRGENEMNVQKQRGADSIATENVRGRWDIDKTNAAGKNQIDVANIQASASRYSADKRESSGSDSKIYEKYFQQQDEDGNVTMYGVRRDNGKVEPVGPEGVGKGASKEKTAAIEKIGELINAGDYDTARAIAKQKGIPLKEAKEVIEKNWFSEDKTRDRPSIDIDKIGGGQQGLLNSATQDRTTSQSPTEKPKTQEKPQTPDDYAKQLKEMAQRGKAAQAAQAQPATEKPSITIDQINQMGKTSSRPSPQPQQTKAPAPGEDGNIWTTAGKGLGFLKESVQASNAVRNAIEQRGITDPTKKMLIETDLRSKYPNATDEELIQLILSAK